MMKRYRQDLLFILMTLLLPHVQGMGVHLVPGVLWIFIFQMVLMGRMVSLVTLCVSGLYLDVLWGQVLGLNVVLFLSVSALTLAVKPFLHDKAFAVLWAGCAAIAGAALILSALMQWAVGGVIDFSFWLSTFMGVVTYPLLVSFLIRALYGKRAYGKL